MAITKTYTVELLRIIEINCHDSIEMIKANYTPVGCEATVRDTYDGQHYKLTIEPTELIEDENHE